MKQLLTKLGLRVDAMSLRERAMVFAAVVAVVVFVAWALLLSPLFARQSILRAQISQNQNNIAGIDDEITRKVTAYSIDPDLANRKRLDTLQVDVTALGSRLRGMRDTLVQPEKMTGLLESMLRANAGLQLTAMRTLPVTPLAEGAYVIPEPAAARAPGAPPAPVPLPKAGYLLYRHGVELTVRGGYLEMVGYLSTLENMPARLYWDKVALNVEQYPNATLTLTVYTLSLDQKWIQL